MHPSSGGRIPFSTASNETGAKQNFGMTFSQPQFQQFPPYRPSGAHNVNYPSSVQVQHGNPRQSYSQVGGIRLNKLHPTMVHQNVAQNQVHAGKIAEIDQKNRLNYHAEKKKLEQQQKLKAFSKVGVKSSIDADTLMENIIGPVLKPVQTKKIQESNKEEDSFGDFVQCQTVDNKENGPSVEIPEQTKNKNVLPVAPVSASYIPDQNPKKGLDLMMKQCTDLSVSSNKASLFQQKKSLSEVAPAKHKSQQFVPSNKACDWSKVKTDLNVSFAAPPELPDWCSSEKVPAIYHKIEVSVINNMGVIDTGLLYPILMSSGLPQQLLAYIWSLANQTTPGQLTQVELYVALALVSSCSGMNVVYVTKFK
ncbi:Synergin gamma [Nymphon striatum]|nr:Synergin gamma [Nymphon striatum]